MGGRASRQKGMRAEYGLRNTLRLLGWEAHRVPSSGAAEGFKGDVIGTKDGRKLVFEVKNYADSFEKIYQLYEQNTKAKQDDLLTFVAPHEDRLCVRISTSLHAVLNADVTCFEFADRNPLYTKFKRTYEKLMRMQRLLKGADILVIKQNHKPLLYIRYQ